MKSRSGSPTKIESEKRKRYTSYDVAQLAGVSQSTVTRVFKGSSRVSKNKAERVMAAANRLGYRPNAIARGLTTQRSNLVAIVISELTTLNYPEVFVNLAKDLSDQGFTPLIFTSEDRGDFDHALEKILQYRVDGIIIAGLFFDDSIKTISAAEVPIVFYNRESSNSSVSTVMCGHESDEYGLVHRLIIAGHKSFGIIEGPSDSVVSLQRKSGVLRALKESGIKNYTLVSGDYGYESGRKGFSEIMKRRGGTPEAVVALNDIMAIGAIDEARHQYNLLIPENLSVVGFDGVIAARFEAYSLTTISQPVSRMSQAAVGMLIERINDPSLPPEKRVFSGKFIQGKTSSMLAE